LEIKTFPFSTPVLVTSGNKYWAVLDCSGSTYVWYVRTNSSVYADGEGGYGSNADLSDFIGDPTYDCRQFKVNGEVTVLTSQDIFLRGVDLGNLTVG
jgi:hypothetical protein